MEDRTTTIPNVLKSLPQWVEWGYNDEGAKVPKGKSNDPWTWTTFERIASKEKIAFVFSEQDPFCGIDLDDCVTEEGGIAPNALAIVERFGGIAYAEFSPSGKGIKLITRGKKPNWAQCKRGPIECYDRLRYWTITGNVIGDQFRSIGDGQEAIDSVCREYLAKPQEPKPTSFQPSLIPSAGLLDRAQSYIETCSGVGQGERNPTGFRLAGHLFAIVDEYGGSLSQDEVLQFVRQWNQTNLPPMGENEVVSIVASAFRNGQKRELKPPTIFVQDNSDVDLTEFLKSFEPDESEIDLKPSDPGPFPADCLEPPGLIGEVCRYTLETSDERQPILALGGAMALLSVLTGRKVRNKRNNRTNVFVLGLAPSGAGKDRPRTVNMDILRKIGHAELIGANSLGSGHGIESQLKLHPAKVFHLDEIGDLLKAIKKERGGGSKESVLEKIKVLMTSSHSIYSNSATADAKLFFTIDQPHLVIFATATPEKFWSNLGTDAIEDGFMGRILPLEVPGYNETQEPDYQEIPESILTQAKAWAQFNPGGGNLNPEPAIYEYTNEALERHRQYCNDIDDRVPKDGTHKPTDGLWKRARGRAAQLALLFAASRQGPTEGGLIELVDVNLSIKIINWITRRTIYKISTQVAETPFAQDCNRVLRIVQASGERGIGRKELVRKANWMKTRERNDVISSLTEAGRIYFGEDGVYRV